MRRETVAGRDRSGGGESMFPQWMLEHVDRTQPSHEEKVIVLEELERLLQGLPQELRQIVLWKLEGYTNAEIACSIGRHGALRGAEDAIDSQAARALGRGARGCGDAGGLSGRKLEPTGASGFYGARRVRGVRSRRCSDKKLARRGMENGSAFPLITNLDFAASRRSVCGVFRERSHARRPELGERHESPMLDGRCMPAAAGGINRP